MLSEPSLGVLDAKTIGKVAPPSVESKMFTFAVLIPLAVVPATFQVTVAVDPVSHVVLLVAGEVIANAAPVFTTFTAVKTEAVCPPPSTLSLTVKEKFNVRATVETVSQVVVSVPFNTSENLGMYLVPEVVGGSDLKFGPFVLVGDGILAVAPTVVASLFCSQQ